MIRPGDLVLARDHDRKQLHRALQDGVVTRLRVGAYLGVDTDDGRAAYGSRRAKVLMRAVHRQLRAPHTFSHQSAALWWGCSLWKHPDQTHLVQDYRASGRAAKDVKRHRGTVPDDQRALERGLPVTTLARTVVDCALSMHPMEALVIADSALRLQPALDLDEARAILDGVLRRNGRVRARWVLDHADGGADSPWETWTRYLCLRVSLPRPLTQAPVVTRLGTYHCDLGWPDHGVYVEFDGRVKYLDDGVRRGHDAREELLREKRRTDALHEAGVLPVRVMAGDARPAPGTETVLQRIARRFPAPVRRQLRVVPFLPPPVI
ncbi:hypothetical protein [Isoptericola halotolerans]|uniref:Transcriptional regulator, AbiEi antitoxin, Type IV TA system n=1 Tax=Isoptericola halotolerans TaxID=300560 RepID=A0ABX2A0Z8_9MICO|nr:hypothetical protein [Isoptericola halotolerans]NOV96420.1 hypothetical protein [Isoptericola halotolerans]